MSQFIFPPLTASLDSEQTNGGSLPAKQMVVAGFDSTATRVLLTDSSGRLEINAVVSLPLPSGAATAALQTAGNNLLTTIDADTSILAGAVSSGQMQVDVVAPLPAGTNAIGKLAANSGVDIGDVDVTSLPSIPVGTNSIGTVGLDAGTNTIGKLGANSGVDIGDVDVTSLPSIPAGTNSIGTVILGAGTAAIGKLSANSGVDIGDVDVTSLPALPSGTNTIGKVDVNAIAPVDFLDAGVLDTSTTNIPSTGVTVVASTGLAAACTEIEIQEDIGEFMSLRVGGTVKAYLPLGGGRVKVSLAATDAVQLYSETGTTINSGKIAINFLG